MALHWDLGKIKDYKELCFAKEDDTKYLSPITEGLIWATMLVDLSSITEKNFSEWMWRIHFLKQLNKIDLLYEEKTYRTFTKDEVKAHIGLGTNASTLTRTQFVNKWVRVLKMNCDANVKQLS